MDQFDKESSRLLDFIDSACDIEEFRTLCFNLNVDFDNLGGRGKKDKARDLLILLQRTNRIEDILKTLYEMYPERFRQEGFDKLIDLPTESQNTQKLTIEPESINKKSIGLIERTEVLEAIETFLLEILAIRLEALGTGNGELAEERFYRLANKIENYLKENVSNNEGTRFHSKALTFWGAGYINPVKDLINNHLNPSQNYLVSLADALKRGDDDLLY